MTIPLFLLICLILAGIIYFCYRNGAPDSFFPFIIGLSSIIGLIIFVVICSATPIKTLNSISFPQNQFKKFKTDREVIIYVNDQKYIFTDAETYVNFDKISKATLYNDANVWGNILQQRLFLSWDK